MEVLVCLADRAGDVVSAEDIIAVVWGGRPMGDNPVYKTVAKLRKALGDDSVEPAYIVTVPKRGYRLVAPVGQPDRPSEQRSRSALKQAAPIALGLVLGVLLAAALFWRPGEETASIRPISTFAGSHSQPSFGPDGESVAFVNETDGVPHIWILDAGESQPLVNCRG